MKGNAIKDNFKANYQMTSEHLLKYNNGAGGSSLQILYLHFLPNNSILL